MAGIRKSPCVVGNIEKHGNGVYSIDLIPERHIPVFRPGQFLHLALDEYDPSGFWPDSRAFSIASSPSDLSKIKIAYSVKGKFTTRMENELAKGRRVWIKLPYGEFIIEGENNVALVAGGTGITAFSAFLEGLSSDINQTISLFYGARNENLLLYNDMLKNVSKRVKNFQINYALETKPTLDTLNGFPTRIGALSVEWVWKSLENPAKAVFFLSGPPPMLKRFSTDLKSYKVPEKQIRIDAWE